MAVKQILNIVLYTDTGANSATAKKYLDANGVQYRELCYRDEGQHPEVFAPLSTWNFSNGAFNLNAFPFVIYNELHDDSPAMTVAFIGGDPAKSKIVSLSRLK